MRVTNLMTATNILADLEKNYKAISRANGQISSGKKVNRLSDDPGLLDQILNLKTTFDKHSHHASSIASQISRLNRSEIAFAQAVDILGRARDLIIKVGPAALDKGAMAEVADKLLDEMVAAANASTGSINGDQIFYRDGKGKIWLNADYLSPVVKNKWGTDDILDLALLGDIIDPAQVFGEGAPSDSVFDILSNLKEKLTAGDIDGARSLLGPLDGKLETIIQERSKIGAKVNLLEGLKSKLEDQQLRLNEFLSKLEDADIAGTAMELSQQQLTYQAALTAGIKLLHCTLLNFLK